MSPAVRGILFVIVPLALAGAMTTSEATSADAPRRELATEHWALQPLRSAPPPPRSAWSRNEIDDFVFARLQRAGLAPADEADRRTLIRRLAFDLHGLPPSPVEVLDFESDSSPDAYSRLVDRYLDAPQFGERWARHWLDVVRFGESTGFEHNSPWLEAWRYRDWVIHAFNSDLPYDEFVRLQIAGDVLRPNDPLAVTATGFLVCGPYDKIGNELGTENMRKMTRQTELGELVGTVTQTFLGLTVDCARCHDHKFDPISQRDYFQVAASLGGVRGGSRPNRAGELAPAIAARLEKDTGETAALERRFAAAAARAGEPFASRYRAGQKKTSEKKMRRYDEVVLEDGPLGYWRLDEPQNASRAKNLGRLGAKIDGKYEGGILRGQKSLIRGQTTGAVQLAPGKRVTVPPFEKSAGGRGFTVEFWLQHTVSHVSGFQNLVGDGESGSDFNLMVYSGGGGFLRAHLQTTAGIRAVDSVRRLKEGETVHVVSVWDAKTGDLALYLNGSEAATNVSIGALPDRGSPVHTNNGLFFGADGRGPGPTALLDEVAIYDQPLSPARIALHARAGGRYEITRDGWDDLLEQLDGDAIDRVGQSFGLLRTLSSRRLFGRLAEFTSTHAVVPQQPPVFHVLARGDFKKPRAVVAPGGIAVVSASSRQEPSGDLGLKPDAPEKERRARLARWITQPRNPLIARVMVNRLWHYHFGAGLVRTPNDFGVNGEAPTHPALLDWLAWRLIDGGWRLKPIHRLIVTSATYRQRSSAVGATQAVDTENRLLWRMNPRRLEGEAVRDTLLAVSGRLNPRLGGPGFRDFRIQRKGDQHHYVPVDVQRKFERRSIYRMWARSGTTSFLAAFDCPNESVRTPARAVTTTPLQALALFNSSFVERQARALAESVIRRGGESVPARVSLVYRLTLQRAPSDAELKSATSFIEEHGLQEFCLVLFNCNEFLYVD